MTRSILFVPYDKKTGQSGDWFEFRAPTREEFQSVYGIVRDYYPRRDGYEIIITTNEGPLPMMEVRPYVGTFILPDETKRARHRRKLELILDIEPGSLS